MLYRRCCPRTRGSTERRGSNSRVFLDKNTEIIRCRENCSHLHQSYCCHRNLHFPSQTHLRKQFRINLKHWWHSQWHRSDTERKKQQLDKFSSLMCCCSQLRRKCHWGRIEYRRESSPWLRNSWDSWLRRFHKYLNFPPSPSSSKPALSRKTNHSHLRCQYYCRRILQ